MSRTALVTGATGFIGGRLVRRLVDDGWRVVVLARGTSDTDALPPDVEVIRTGRDPDALRDAIAAAAPDIVYHLASLYLADHQPDEVEPLIGSNILFLAELAEAMTRAGCSRLVNAGTAWQHAGTDADRPVNLYAATKRAAEEILRYYQEARALSVVTLTLFDSYGPGDTRRKLVQLLVGAALGIQRLDMSPGEQRVDLTHVDDITAAFVIAGERLLRRDGQVNERFFVGGDRLTVRDLVARVAAALDRPLAVAFGGKPYRPREVMEPVAATPLLPGWRQTVGLDDGIRLLADEGRSRRNRVA